MAIKTMKDYLTAKVADYITTELLVTPQRTMTEGGDKSQIVHEADDGDISVVSLSEKSIFTVSLLWEVISIEDSGTIMDLYHDPAKANGRERSFYWHHPTDGNIYTVRFLGPLERVYSGKMPTHRKISQIKLRVEGYK